MHSLTLKLEASQLKILGSTLVRKTKSRSSKTVSLVNLQSPDYVLAKVKKKYSPDTVRPQLLGIHLFRKLAIY